MKVILKSLALVFVIFLMVLRPNLASADLGERWQLYLNQTEENKNLELLKDKDVVFVKGFLSFDEPRYFQDSAHEAVEILGATEAHLLGPKSKNSITRNSDIIYRYLINLHKKNNKPQVIVAHSKGAAEVMVALLFHPDLITNHIVDKAVLIQGTIRGSPLAALARKKCEKEHGFCYPIYELLQLGFYSMEPSQVDHIFSNLIQGQEDQLAKLFSNRVFYVRGYNDPKKFRSKIKLVNYYLGDQGVMHDGLVPVENQYRPEFGCVLATYNNLEHIGLVSWSKPKFLRTFTHAFLDEVYSKTPECTSAESQLPVENIQQASKSQVALAQAKGSK